MVTARANVSIAAAALATVLAACSAPGAVTPAGPQAVLSTRGGDAGASTTWAKSVFVSDHFVSKVYQFADAKNGALLGTITDSSDPVGLDMDSSGKLYVAAEGDYGINVYAPGTYSARQTLSDPGEFISSVAVCPNGTVYAANEFAFNQQPGNIEIYAPGATSPTGTVPDANIYSAGFASCDQNSVLWFTYTNASFTMQVAAYNGIAVTEYGNLNLGGADSASGIRALSSGKLAIGNTSVGINRYADPPTKKGPTRPLGCRVGSALTFSFGESDEDIYEIDSSQSVEKCNAAGKELYTIGQGTLETAADVFAFPAGND